MLFLNFLPGIDKIGHVVFESLLRAAFRRGPDDESAAFRKVHFSGHLAESLSFLDVADPSGNGDLFLEWHQDKEAARQADVGRKAAAFRADGFFHDLDDDLLLFFQDVGDLQILAVFRAVLVLILVLILILFLAFFLVLVVKFHGVKVGGENVVDVDEAVFLKADVDESRVDGGNDVLDPAFVHAAHVAVLLVALDVVFLKLLVFHDGDATFLGLLGVDYDLSFYFLILHLD